MTICSLTLIYLIRNKEARIKLSWAIQILSIYILGNAFTIIGYHYLKQLNAGATQEKIILLTEIFIGF